MDSSAIKNPEDLARAIASASKPMPDLGDPSVVHEFTLSDPEICAIWAAVAFVKGASAQFEHMSGTPLRWWNHYGPTLEKLDARLRIFDDSEVKAHA